jgi:hypothetical protein
MRFIVAAILCLVTLLIGGVVFAFCAVPAAHLTVRNETSRSVTIGIETRIEEEVPPNETEVIHAGLLFGRWGAPSTVRIDSVECRWDDVHGETLVLRDGEPPCVPAFEYFPEGLE